MEFTYKTGNGKLLIKFTGDNIKDVFQEIAQAVEIFDAQDKCGKCGSTNINPHFRIAGKDKYKYYELQCGNPECGARFSFGQSKDMKSLFPKYEEGWTIYRPNGGREEERQW